ncbi:MAG TPA: glutathione S-transferase N-terminal domain-containing protein [Thermoleophilaceae bacterium]|nr:glutathione S-transferase N-terminal domain-containing protein [Thermoleophilaceae bacterium]
MRAVLIGVPASHPTVAAELMLARKGIGFERYDLVPGLHRFVLRRAFPGGTVPAIVLDGQRLQGTRTISRALDVLVPEPALFPDGPKSRAAVEQAELWGDLVLQPAVRRLAWAALKRDRSTIRSFLEDAKLGLPTGLAVATAGPVVAWSAWLNRAGDKSARRDLAALPRLLDRVDELLAEGVLSGDGRPSGDGALNAADCQIAPTVRFLLAFDDLREAVEARPAGRHALRVLPRFAGRIPPVFPTEWIRSVG